MVDVSTSPGWRPLPSRCEHARAHLAGTAGRASRATPEGAPHRAPPWLRCSISSPISTSPSIERSRARRHPRLDAPLRPFGVGRPLDACSGAAGALFLLGGKAGRRAAVTGVVALGVNSAVVNLPMKFASGRARPDRESAAVPEERRVPMPTSSSFPSGHSASAFAFAGAVAGSMPGIAVPLRGLATAVAYSRVHTGVHSPATSSSGRSLVPRSARRRRSWDERSAAAARRAGRPETAE